MKQKSQSGTAGVLDSILDFESGIAGSTPGNYMHFFFLYFKTFSKVKMNYSLISSTTSTIFFIKLVLPNVKMYFC